MEWKTKGGWGVPVVVAVGVFAYYCASLRLSPDPQERRRAILQRLYDGASPRALLREGYTRAELHDAGVPRAALSVLPPREHHPLSSSHSDTSRSRSTELLLHPHPLPEPQQKKKTGILSSVFAPLSHVTDTLYAASESITGNLRGRSASTSLGDVKAISQNATTHAAAAPAPPPHEAIIYGSTRTTSIRLAPELLRSEAPTTTATTTATTNPQKTAAETISPERGRSRTPGGATQVHVGALSAAVARGYSQESATYKYPLDVVRFLHEDGSRLSVMAESCSTVESDGALTTDTYVQRSLARARSAADVSKAYFKVKLSTVARNIATTVMESYVNIHVGPSPVILACFYLVSRGVAYTIQLQTHTGVYEERLADLLYTVQSARLHDTATSSAATAMSATQPGWKSAAGENGCTVFQMQVVGVEDFYAVSVPLSMTASVDLALGGRRSVLRLAPCGSNEQHAAWAARVDINAMSAPPSSPHADTKILFRDASVAVTLSVSVKDTAIKPPDALDAITARRATAEDDRLPLDAYVSPLLTLPLPSLVLFKSVVCEHPREPAITLFISTRTSAEPDVFEMELHCLHHFSEGDLAAFFAYVDTLLLTPARPQRSVNTAGQQTFSVEGLAAAPAETTLRVCGVHVRDDNWLVMRWLYPDSAVFTRELEQFRRCLMDEVLC